MLGEQILAQHGVSPAEIRWVPMAQNWDSVRSVLVARSADAILCEEPFVTRAVDAGLAKVLLHFNELTASRRLPGDGHLRAVVSAPRSTIGTAENDGRAVTKMVAKSLSWMATAGPDRIVDQLGIAEAPERSELLRLLGRYPGLFPSQPRFDPQAVAATGALLAALGLVDQPVVVDTLIDQRWTDSH